MLNLVADMDTFSPTVIEMKVLGFFKQKWIPLDINPFLRVTESCMYVQTVMIAG